MNTFRQDSLAGIVVFLVACRCASASPCQRLALRRPADRHHRRLWSSPPSAPPASPSAAPPPDWSPSSSPPLNPGFLLPLPDAVLACCSCCSAFCAPGALSPSFPPASKACWRRSHPADYAADPRRARHGGRDRTYRSGSGQRRFLRHCDCRRRGRLCCAGWGSPPPGEEPALDPRRWILLGCVTTLLLTHFAPQQLAALPRITLPAFGSLGDLLGELESPAWSEWRNPSVWVVAVRSPASKPCSAVRR